MTDIRLWFTKEPHEICQRLGIAIDKRRAWELSQLFDGDINGWYYLWAASMDDYTEEAAKWILGALAARLNTLNLSFKESAKILPPNYLNAFVRYMKQGKFDRGFSKEIFSELLLQGPQWHIRELIDDMTVEEVELWLDNPIQPMSGNEIMDKIIAMPKFQAIPSEEIDTLIEKAISDHTEQAAKVSDQPKLLQWFVGQVMKASKGKLPASKVLEKLNERFSK